MTTNINLTKRTKSTWQYFLPKDDTSAIDYQNQAIEEINQRNLYYQEEENLKDKYWVFYIKTYSFWNIFLWRIIFW